MNYHLSPESLATIAARQADDYLANAERRKARALNNLPPVQTVQDFLDSVSAKQEDRRFSGEPITGFGNDL